MTDTTLFAETEQRDIPINFRIFWRRFFFCSRVRYGKEISTPPDIFRNINRERKKRWRNWPLELELFLYYSTFFCLKHTQSFYSLKYFLWKTFHRTHTHKHTHVRIPQTHRMIVKHFSCLLWLLNQTLNEWFSPNKNYFSLPEFPPDKNHTLSKIQLPLLSA